MLLNESLTIGFDVFLLSFLVLERLRLDGLVLLLELFVLRSRLVVLVLVFESISLEFVGNCGLVAAVPTVV